MSSGARVVDGLELDRYHYLHATRAELLRSLGRVDDARASYDRALELVNARRGATLPRTAARGAPGLSRGGQSPAWERAYASTTFWGTHICQASSTSSRIRPSSIAPSRTTAQL